jgi:enamine deaminase RidA (YjgF/YER057c/UK114 family)
LLEFEDMCQIENRLLELGYALPAAPAAAGNYLPYRISGQLLYLSGVLPVLDGQLSHTGKVGQDLSEEEAYVAAKNCVLSALANIKAALGSLDRVNQVLLVNGFVNGVEGFSNSPQVINGASDFLVELFGEAGRHARAAVSVSGLPKNVPVELQITLEFK